MKKNLALLTVIIAANLLVYRQITGFQPVNLDEPHLISEKWRELKDGSRIGDAFRQNVFGSFYRPVLTLSFMMDAWRSKDIFEPVVFYKTNLFLHLLNAVLCFALLAGLGYPPGLAAAGTLIFSLHPALAGASGWIPGRNDSLLFLTAALALLSLGAAVKRRSAALFTTHLACFLAALLTKETAILLVVVFPAWAIAAGWRGSKRKMAVQAALASCGWALCLTAYLFARGAVLKDAPPVPWPGFAALAERMAFYAGYLFFPDNAPVYAWFQDLALTRIFIVNAAALVLFAGVWRLGRRHIIPMAAAAMYILILPSAFSDSFIPHRSCLPAFFCALAVTEAGFLLRVKGGSKVLVLLGAAALYLGIGTYAYLGNFKGPEAFWSDAYKASPSSQAAYELGYLAQLRGEDAVAEKYYLKSLARNPNVTDASNNLGVIKKQAGRYAEAMKLYERELELTPGRPMVLENIGNLLMAQGKYREAAGYFKRKISAEPDIAKTYASLIFCLRRQGMNTEADEYTARLAALQKKP